MHAPGYRGFKQFAGESQQEFYIVDPDSNEVQLTRQGLALDRGIEDLTWVFTGTLAQYNSIDHYRVALRDGEIKAVYLIVGQRGNAGDIIVDLNKAVPGTPHTTQQNNFSFSTIYTTQANRPKIVGEAGKATENAFVQATLPDVVAFNKGDIFDVDIDSVTANSEDLVLKVEVRYL